MSSDNSNHVPHALPTNGNGGDKLTGLTGLWRQVANFGLVGLLSGLLLFLVYEQQQDIRQSREDARAAHADVARLNAELAANRNAIDKLTTALDALRWELRRDRAARGPE